MQKNMDLRDSPLYQPITHQDCAGRCKRTNLPVSMFNEAKNNKHGYAIICKYCAAEYAKDYNFNNKIKTNKYRIKVK